MQFVKKHPYFILCLSTFVIAFFTGRYGILDWNKEIYFNNVIKDALSKESQLPAVIWQYPESLSHYPVFKATHIFWAIPETLLFSPLVFFMRFLDAVRFQHLHAILFILIGFWGFCELKKALKLDDSQSSILEAGIFLSPMMIQHLAVGYSPWVCLYLLPCIFNFLLARDFLFSIMGLSLILATSLLVGGQHPFVLFSMLVGLLSLCYSIYSRSYRVIVRIGIAIVLAVLIGVGRWAPSMVAFAGFKQELLAGYSIRKFLHYAFVPPFLWGQNARQFIEEIADNVASWDGGNFWGPLLFIAFLLRWPKKNFEKALFSTGLILSFFSFYGNWGRLLGLLPTVISEKIISAEKYPYRWMQMAYFSFLFLIVLSEKEWSKKLPKKLREYRVYLISVPMCWAFVSWSAILIKNSTPIPFAGMNSYQRISLDEIYQEETEYTLKTFGVNDIKFLTKVETPRENYLEFTPHPWIFLRNFSWAAYACLLMLFLYLVKRRRVNL